MKWLAFVTCPACGGNFEPSAPPFVCAQCRRRFPHVGSSPALLEAGDAGDLDALETDFDYGKRVERKPGLRFAYRDRRRNIERRILEAHRAGIGRPLNVLDVGGGDPFRSATSYHQRWKDLFHVCVVVEPSLPILRRSVPDEAIGMIQASGELIPVRRDAFDVALCLSTLDHVRDPAAVLEQARLALVPGGRILLDLKNESAWFKPIARRVGGAVRARLEDDHHPWRFSPRELHDLLGRGGFVDVNLIDLHYCSELIPARLDVGRAVNRILARGLAALDVAGARLLPARGAAMIATARKPHAP